MKNNKAVVQRVRDTIEKYDLVTKGDQILVAVSGGADSVCLLDALNRLKDEFALDLAVVHLHHGLRGEAADHDAAFTGKLAERYHCRFFEKKVDVSALAKKRKISLETAGREERYRYFFDLAEEYGFQKIATAHNQNDLAETVLMRLIRGTGIQGLGGISAKRGKMVIRPLIEVSREEIEAYCREYDLAYCIDHTNADNQFTRNKIRNQILPLMKEINPAVISNVAHTAVNIREDATFLDAYAHRLYQTLNNPRPSHKPTLLHIESLQMVGFSIQARLVQIAAKEVIGPAYQMEQKHIYAILQLCEKQTGAQICLPDNLIVAVKYGWLEFTDTKKEKKSVFFDEEIEIEYNKEYFFPEIRKKVSIVEQAADLFEKKADKDIFYLDADKLNGEKLYIRRRRKGDRIAVYSDGKQKSVKRLMIDMKIPQSLRDTVPLLATKEDVLAVLGYRISEKYKRSKKSERVLVVCYESE